MTITASCRCSSNFDTSRAIISKSRADCFFPVPDVDSACVTLIRRDPPLLPRDRHAAFEKIVKRAFSQRRKMMFKLLKADWPEDKLAAAFAQLGFLRKSGRRR